MRDGAGGVAVGLLGPVTAWLDGAPAPLGGPKPRALLARLAIARGRVLTDSALIEDLWGDEPPRSALTTLQGYVAGLRRSLEPGRGAAEAAVLVRQGPGYALCLGAAAVDADRFADLTARATDDLAAGDAAAAERAGLEALGLWRGPALAGCGDREFALAAAARLDDLREGLRETVWSAQLALGRHHEVAAELGDFTREHPLRERGWELLALAHYRAGRQADALASLRAARDVLEEELGADPGPGLTSLSRAILRQDPALDLPAPADRRPARSAVVPEPEPPAPRRPGPGAAALPVPTTPFLGRGDDVDAVGRLLDQHRLVTLAAAGGMGKTRLALAVAGARDRADGPWFVDLAPVQDGDRVVDVMATTLGSTGAGTPAELAALLGERHVLLVLDNCEQVIAAVAAVVTDVLARCPGVTVLATSREPLLVPGERVHWLGPLPREEAVTLFRERVAAFRPDWRPDAEEESAVSGLCDQLDRMPLALELAAAQCRLLSVHQVAALVGDRMALRWTGNRGGGRHATMRTAIAWSVEQLEPEERAVFAELGVFAGGFDLDAAAAVTGRPDVLLTLGGLVDKSLVVVEGGHPARYRVLEVLRQYAAELRDPEQDRVLRDRHVAWVRSFTDHADRALRGSDSAAWMRRLATESANVRSALDHCAGDPATALEIAAGMYWFWFRRGPVVEGLQRLSGAVAAIGATPVPHSTLVRAAVGTALLSYLRGDLAGLLGALERVGVLGASAVEPADRAYAFATLAFFEASAGSTGPAREHAGIALAVADELDLDHIRAEALMCLGTASFREGDHTAAAEQLQACLRAAQRGGYTWCAVSAAWLLAKSRIAAGEPLPGIAVELIAAADACVLDEDVTSWLVVLATLAYVAFRGGLVDDALLLSGVVARYGEEVGFVPEAMDAVELARYGAEIREAVPADDHADGLRRGRALPDREVEALVRALPAALARG
ncbi:AfsR/SARP family transcriptional regulator [Blastococcus litoris]|uniref:AfsR/SARP family transcriptional regulator n=1 Tax=Blastococcus litoris TaxID=2171622 RepID=UPI0013E03416|nr:BTAD domain-containing putative transcriptional regulator [Blastococcus litoris]